MTNNEIAFTNQQVDAAYVNSLVDLVNACRENHVAIDKVAYYQHGWSVTFKGHDGDAICHSGSYGSPCYGGLYNPEMERNDWNNSGRWETIGFPWDGGDISVHYATHLAHMIGMLNRGEEYNESWEEWEED
jgi:hypothetical protein